MTLYALTVYKEFTHHSFLYFMHKNSGKMMFLHLDYGYNVGLAGIQTLSYYRSINLKKYLKMLRILKSGKQ